MNTLTDQIKLCDLLMDDITQNIKTRAVIIQFDEHLSHRGPDLYGIG